MYFKIIIKYCHKRYKLYNIIIKKQYKHKIKLLFTQIHKFDSMYIYAIKYFLKKIDSLSKHNF